MPLSFMADVLHSLDERRRVELRAKNLIGAVRQNRDSPVADERHDLFRLSSLDLRAQMFSQRNAAFTFYVDQNKIVMARPEHGQAFYMAEGRIHLET